MEIAANTSCSVYTINPSGDAKNEVFHLLIDIGEGVVKSIEKVVLLLHLNPEQRYPISLMPY